jgi:hypothetical protein
VGPTAGLDAVVKRPALPGIEPGRPASRRSLSRPSFTEYRDYWKSRVEVGSNTSTVALRVVGGHKMELSAWDYNWATLFLGDTNRDLALQVGGISDLRQQNVVLIPAGLGPEIDCAGEDQQQL